MIYTHVAAGLLGAAIAANSAWQIQDWRLGGQIEAMKTAQATAALKAEKLAC
ncbi:hypothetical protein GCM10027082_14060 [Comamonas humi]